MKQEDVDFAEAREVVMRYLTVAWPRLQHADREDIAQEVGLRLHREVEGGKRIANLSAWVIKAARYRAMDRTDPKRNWQESVDPMNEAGVIASRNWEAATVLEGVVSKERLVFLGDFVNYQLPATHRAVIDAYSEGLTHEEGAKRVGVSRATYCSRLAEALVMMKPVADDPGRISSTLSDLATAVVGGVATIQERTRAKTLRASSPAFAAECTRQKRILTGAGLLLPPSVLAPASGGGVLAAIGHFLSGLRDKLPWGDGGASAGAGGAAAGSGGGGLLAAGGGKAVAICAVVACGGGAAAIKVATENDTPPQGNDRPTVERPTGPPATVPDALASPITPETEAVSTASGRGEENRDGGEPGHPDAGGKPGHPENSSTGAGTNTDAAVTGQEFDPLASPSPSTPAPAPPAPSTSSGTSSGGSSAGSNTDTAIGGAEFGPRLAPDFPSDETNTHERTGR